MKHDDQIFSCYILEFAKDLLDGLMKRIHCNPEQPWQNSEQFLEISRVEGTDLGLQ